MCVVRACSPVWSQIKRCGYIFVKSKRCWRIFVYCNIVNGTVFLKYVVILNFEIAVASVGTIRLKNKKS